MEEKKERTEEMIKMRQSGATYAEIAKRFCVSKQRVYMIVGVRNDSRFKMITPEQCVYPNIRKWMNGNKISVSEISRRMFGNAAASNHLRIREILRGKRVSIAKPTIDKLIEATGLKYEELFEKERNGNE